MPNKTFNSQGGWQRWDVPDGVTRVTVDLKGAGTGGTAGGRVSGTLKVGKGDSLWLLVGAQGKAADGRQGGAAAAGGGGRGGDGSSGHNGGRGGGGAAAIRLNSSDGSIRAVAGGAGGKSGDGGDGGHGGDKTGGAGHAGSTGSGSIGNATGGTQIQPGAGGTSSAGKNFSGDDAESGNLGRGGAGGQHTADTTHGGGGGGGGYRAGGGGCAAVIGQTPGGGGGGGSNFTGGLITSSSSAGGGNTGDAVITLTWTTPPPANQPPGVPSDVKVNKKAESPNMTTRSTGTVTISAIVRDSDSHTVDPDHVGGAATQAHQKSRLVVRYSDHKSMSGARTVKSALTENDKRAEVKITGLAKNTLYFARLYAEDNSGLRSKNYNGVTFWTNRPPSEPVLQGPSENTTLSVLDATTFNWAFKDPDDNDVASAFKIRWRKARTPIAPAGPWTVKTFDHTPFDNYVADPGTFKAGVYYEWSVRTRDAQRDWGPWALARSFYVTGPTIPPTLLSPIRDEAVEVSGTVTVKWKYRDFSEGTTQVKADLRYRVVGAAEWVLLIGDVSTPGSDMFWELPTNIFAPGYRYEWQIRTTSSGSVSPSDWSESDTFMAYASQVPSLPIDFVDIGQVLGSGVNRVYIYDRGGIVRRGEVTPAKQVMWSRVRDDLGALSVTTNGFDSLAADLFRATHTWTHELVVFRDGVRVAEGPITKITDTPTGFTIDAYDVMGYVYRRIMRQGYNDTYKVVNNVPEGLRSVVQRAGIIIANALAPNDPNVLPYLTMLSYPDDAQEARTAPDYSKTAFAEIDDMAANAGLDFSVIGRRIILNDTHRPVGRGIELRTENFTAPPVIAEYGLSLADYYAATDNNGLWGAAQHEGSPYGGVEILATGFTDATEQAKTLTREQRDRITKSLTEQAQRGIASRYPAPYQVRVPDNTQLLPDTPIDINSLVPGVWHPLRAQGTVIEISQWQKLDSVTVTQDASGEKVAVVFSPAPNRGEDPDADGVGEAQVVET
jgi:hypothetical protein